MYVKEIKATHVIIAGCVFSREEKEPYVPSGASVLGALELDAEHNVVKCHVCGEWFTALGCHVRSVDGISPAEYRATYGLNADTALCSPQYQEARAKQAKRNTAFRMSQVRLGAKPSLSNQTPRNTAELRNLRMLCQAQIRRRVHNLAIELGGTPRKPELKRAGLHNKVFRQAFDMTMNAFMQSIGLSPNRCGNTRREPLPANFGR